MSLLLLRSLYPSIHLPLNELDSIQMDSEDYAAGGPHLPQALQPIAATYHKYARMYQYQLDRTTPHTVNRWLSVFILNALFLIRIVFAQGVCGSRCLGVTVKILISDSLLPTSGTSVSPTLPHRSEAIN